MSLPRHYSVVWMIWWERRVLNDRTLSEAVALQNPKSLDEAVALIKSVKIKKENIEESINVINRKSNGLQSIPQTVEAELSELRRQVSNLNQVVFAIKAQIKALSGQKPRF